ncbi:hypothetical protein HMPREF2087_01076 [Helicobacter canis NCTC 12740]|uniref:Replication-associated recombination protein A n=1 Tax=Helicobacter canis NCTC 12740 TaxID=1357399 RepID=V8CIW4_9HELI|nr:hypothetical protein HMPREF2087_01076 [Helicobacter canis NCTC 12740]
MTHLAALLRPQTLADFLGQSHLLHKNAPLYRAIVAKQMPHCFFYGPPGSGKTTLARLIAKELGDVFLPFNATKFKLDSLHSALKPYEQSLITPLIFIDEVHRLSKPQQEALLPIMEERSAIVLGASTENPFYTLTNAIRSRSLLCEFKPLQTKELEELLRRALRELGIEKVESTFEALESSQAQMDSMDRHALSSDNARNDRSSASSESLDSSIAKENTQNLNEPAKDSRIFNKNAENMFSQNAARRQDFGDRIVALQGDSRAHTRAYVTAESSQQSAILAKKPTPKTITQEACTYLISSSGGDGRAMLNVLEVLALSDTITLEDVKSLRPVSLNDGTSEDDTHYNLASALIKSIRGSDVDASIYYLARLIAGGENPEFIARRLVILASEDIGNANPNALNLATSTMLAVSKIGYPEARIILAQCVIYLASCPKSNTAYNAINAALEAINQGEILPISPHILPHSKTYKYPHNFGGYIKQQYLLKPLQFVKQTQKGFEKTLNEWLAKIHQS